MQDINNTRSAEMRQRMVLLREKGTCLFCKEGLTLLEKSYLFESDHWFITVNDNPYEGAIKHVLAVPKRHIISPEELNKEEVNELLKEVIPWLRTVYKMDGLSGLFRFGNTRRTGATIHHFHIHFIEGADREDQNHEPIFAVVGFKQK